MEIKWNKLAVKQLLDAIQYLEDNELFAYAEKIEKEILSKIKSLPKTSQIYQLDRLKKKNNGDFHAFEVDRYRISYRKMPKEIRILRIRHSSRRPFTR
ncbi:Plasmid stabilization system protein ParE [Pedobacter steynii]|uniref:Plasmid stabilization system protein ParE n=1 Tax=Pedobacter steynii TaxID=430522 RepID=A0A1H0ICP6_9SPHI|nr:type II toxin-antitoxin system RelE/ParE family toxin [Pedobacter steynii]NQX42863.1 type II toxin-antitoxin system RelE/ParE family toxin [Pedobacter steynii]SDO29153.1 Plasmid stabilization system protein ParE [Pedobacter steynii]